MTIKYEMLRMERKRKEKSAEIEKKMWREQLFGTVAAGLSEFEKTPFSSAGVGKSVPRRRNCRNISLSQERRSHHAFHKGVQWDKRLVRGRGGARGGRTGSWSWRPEARAWINLQVQWETILF